MEFWLGAIVLLVLALGFILYRCLPGEGKGSLPSLPTVLVDQQRSLNIALFSEQQVELDAQRDRGALGEDEYAELLAEAQRRLLSDTQVNAGGYKGGTAPLLPAAMASSDSGRWLLVVAAIALLGFSVALYQRIGAATDIEIAELLRQGAESTSDTREQLHRALVKRTEQSSDNLYYWVLLARLEQQRGDLSAAADAYRGGLVIAPEDANIHAELAQVLFSLAGERVTDEALAHAQRALTVDPANANALGLLGVAAFSHENYSEAKTYWQAALQSLPPMSSNAQALRSGIKRAQVLLGEDVSEWSMSLKVALPAPLVAPADATVFVYLREWQGAAMPLVAQRLQVADLPVSIDFDDSMALSLERKPSEFSQLEVVARIALSGERRSTSGDLEGRLGPLSTKSGQTLLLEINQRLP